MKTLSLWQRLVIWLLDHLFERHDITRHVDDPYLTRWVLWGKRFGEGQKVFLHLFYRGDAEPYNHDHPWSFWSLILWGGYWETTPTGTRWYGPLRLLRRPAEWQHRVTLPPKAYCWTLLWTSAKVRSWGYHCPSRGWIAWRQHEANLSSTGSGCPE